MAVPVALSNAERDEINDIVFTIHDECPGESEYRYLARIAHHRVPGLLSAAEQLATSDQPIVLQNLPHNSDVQKGKILALLIAEHMGKCVAYLDYNRSYLTDVRATTLSDEESATTEHLGMHNDFSWCSDNSRPRALVLLAQVAKGAVPRTLLAPSSNILEKLSAESEATLRERLFEIRVGSGLGWTYEEVRHFALIENVGSQTFVRLAFDRFKPSALLDEIRFKQATKALEELQTVALEVGLEIGHALQQGEALLIPNDVCLHGRDPIDPSECERMLLRAYVAPESVIKYHNNSMIHLGA